MKITKEVLEKAVMESFIKTMNDNTISMKNENDVRDWAERCYEVDTIEINSALEYQKAGITHENYFMWAMFSFKAE
jgi:hypothetical protein